MITPQDIKKQSLSWWKELLLSITTGESFFPKEISRIGKITAKDILLKQNTKLLSQNYKKVHPYGDTQ